MIRKSGVFLILVGLLSCFTLSSVRADSAEVLPKGVSKVSLMGNFYMPVEDRFGPGGDKESVDSDFNAVLDDNVFPLFLPPGENVGRSIVDFEYEFQEAYLIYQYGLTDKLTLGVIIPYWWNKTDVKEVRVDTSAATYGVNPDFGLPLEPPFLPCGAGGICDDTVVTGFVLSALESPPYEFKPLDTWSDSGLSDIELGLRYQYFNNETWRLAFTGGVRLPTGEVDDPDNLLDTEFGDGATALLFQFQNDYIAIDRLTLNGTVRYDLVLPAKEELRVLDDVNQPLAPSVNKEKVDRDIGDKLEFELAGKYSLSKWFDVSLLYRYTSKTKDDVSGDLGLAYESLEDETDSKSQVYVAGITLSTIENYMETKSGIPLNLTLAYRDRFAGDNNALDSEYITLDFSLFF